MSPYHGDPAPAFALPEAPGKIVDLAGRIGERPVVLLFFPLAFSSVCTAEMCAVRDDWSAWEDLDADILGISVDSPFVTRKFKEDNRLPFPVLSDFNREAARAYDVLYEDYFGLRGVAKRAVFVIDRDGRIAYRWVSEDSGVEPDYGEVKAAVERLGSGG